jgi:ubiquinone/menaquinone biosynthesis C-methylase UbiE
LAKPVPGREVHKRSKFRKLQITNFKLQIPMRRTVIAELLDSDIGTPQEIAASLADLRRINRWFGGIATTRAMLRDALTNRISKSNNDGNAGPGGVVTLLDVGAGSGDVPLSLFREFDTESFRLRVILLDHSPLHLRASNDLRGSNAKSSYRVAGDALRLPFHDGSLDLVSCALLAHHLEPDEIIQFVNEALRVARVAVLINDLRRSWLHLALVYAGFVFFRSRFTRHDAPASVRRAYTRQELAAILRSTSAGNIVVRNHYLFRMGAIVWKNAPST